MYLVAIKNSVILLSNTTVIGDHGAPGRCDPQLGQQITDARALGKMDLKAMGMIVTRCSGA
ncbi:MAG: hypothetical protein P8010_22800 [Desulfosarcinaceae bacterium]